MRCSKIIQKNKYVDDTFTTKGELNNVDTKFGNYTTTTDLESNYAKITDLDDYMKKDDIIPTNSEFDVVKGYDYFTVVHSDLTSYFPDDFIPKSNFLKIKIPEKLRIELQESETKLDIFKITLRNQNITDEQGSIIRSFVIAYNNEKFECPTITFTQSSQTYKLTTSKRDNPEVIFAPKLNFDPLTELTNGELVIEYLLNQDSLVAKKPEIRCDIIDAKNALKLRESDVHYFYKPNQLSFNRDVRYIDNDLEWFCESYQMIFKIPDDYEIPVNLNFKFKEYCFGNRWILERDGTKWFGDNIQGRRSSKVMRKINIRAQKDSYGAAGCCVGIKNNDWNRKHIPASDNGLAYLLFENCKNNGKFESKIMFNDGLTANCSDYELVIGYSKVLHGAKFDSYDLVSVSALYRNYSSNILNINDIDCIVLELTQPNEYESNKITFSLGNVHHDSVYNRGF